MKQISSTNQPALSFERNGSQKFIMSQSKVTWLHSLANKPGVKFDLTIKDARGGIRFERKGFGNETEKAGELLNIPFLPGEQIEVVVDKLQEKESVSILLN